MTTHTTNTPERDTGWTRLVTEYHAAVAAREAVTPPADVMNAGDEAEAAFDAAAIASNAALVAMCKYPAPSFAALVEKCELISSEYPDADHLDGQDAAYIIADVRQLAARGA